MGLIEKSPLKMKLLRPNHSQLNLFGALSSASIDSSFSLPQLQQLHQKNSIYSINNSESDVIGFLIEIIQFDEAELLQILIAPPYQQKGFAKQALDAWHTALLNNAVKRVLLEVRCGNTPAMRLYQSLGYEIIGRRKNYYLHAGNTEDALVMEKRL